MSINDVVANWLNIAKNDLAVASHLLYDMHPKQIEIACYHAQQAVEKTLKGFLQHQSVEPPRTHNLIVLCQLCTEELPDFGRFLEDCSDLTGYGVITRYPNELEITESEAESAVKKAQEIYAAGKSAITL